MGSAAACKSSDRIPHEMESATAGSPTARLARDCGHSAARGCRCSYSPQQGVVPRRPERAPGEQQPAPLHRHRPANRAREGSAAGAALRLRGAGAYSCLPHSERFIISDRGLCEFGDLDWRTGKDWPSHGVFFLLGSTLGVLGFLHEPKLHRRVFPTVRLLRAANAKPRIHGTPEPAAVGGR
jgi:hypothetical protein